MALELGEDVFERGSGDVHLIERLHRRQPRGTAAVRLAAWVGCALAHRVFVGDARRRLTRTIVSAARAASPPLSPSSIRARTQACASVSTVRMPLPTGSRRATARSIRARADWIATMSKWIVSPRMTQ